MPTTVLLFLLALLGTVISHDLDCDFNEKCCWKGDKLWQIKKRGDFNLNEFRRTFLVGRSKAPPADNYLVRVESGHGGNYTSCPLCSSNGAVVVQFRHWQSPTARLRLCYKILNQSPAKECQLALASRQSQITSYLFKVPRSQKIQLFFSAESTESSTGSVVMIDRIRVQYTDCHSPSTESTMIPPRPTKKSHSLLSKKPKDEVHIKKARESSHFLANRSKSAGRQMNIKKVKKVSAKDTTAQTIAPPHAVMPELTHQPVSAISPQPNVLKKSVSQSVPSPTPTNLAPVVSSGSSAAANPLHDLLGEPLANFLDPDYVTNEEEDEPEEEESLDDDVSTEKPVEVKKPQIPIREIQKASEEHTPTHATAQAPSKTVSGSILVPGKPVEVNRPAPLSEFHRPLPVGFLSACETVGGCLFEKGYCSYKTPFEVPDQARFQISRIGQTSFAQAKVPAGQVSILEAETKMSENHTIVFDALEWQLGSRLIGCCFVNSALLCPFGTPSEASHVLWQISKFECPANTEKILFICENYGKEEATCGLDNIRLHKSTDIFFFEPCQKNLLSSL